MKTVRDRMTEAGAGADAEIKRLRAALAAAKQELASCKSLRDEAVTGWNEQAELRRERERELESAYMKLAAAEQERV